MYIVSGPSQPLTQRNGQVDSEVGFDRSAPFTPCPFNTHSVRSLRSCWNIFSGYSPLAAPSLQHAEPHQCYITKIENPICCRSLDDPVMNLELQASRWPRRGRLILASPRDDTISPSYCIHGLGTSCSSIGSSRA
jgi:hypothetical protein